MTGANSAAQLTLLPPPRSPRTSHATLRVVVPCSKWKLASASPASSTELDENRQAAFERLRTEVRPAREMYVGRAFKRALRSVDWFVETRPDLDVELHIVSAGFGLLGATDPVVPYEAVLGATPREWTDRGARLGIPGKARELVESSKVTIFALSQPYFHAAQLDRLKPASGYAVVIGASQLPDASNRRSILAGGPQAKGLGTSEREVAAVVLDRLLHRVAMSGLSELQDISPDPLDWAA